MPELTDARRRELDALDARAARAMGWHSEHGYWFDDSGNCRGFAALDDGRIDEHVFSPTRSWADCGLMLEFLRGKGLVGAGVYNDEGTWYGTIRMSDHGYAGDAEELLPAIVLAACEALEAVVEVKQDGELETALEFGMYGARCGGCGRGMEIVRPGKYQCSHCE